MALPKKERIKTRNDFQSVFRTGRSFMTDHLSARVVLGGNGRKSAVLVSVKVAPKATARNLLRRKVSEVLRTLLPNARPGYRIVITIRTPVLPPLPTLREELLSLLEKSDILNR